jgi:hypothetical protein
MPSASKVAALVGGLLDRKKAAMASFLQFLRKFPDLTRSAA